MHEHVPAPAARCEPEDSPADIAGNVGKLAFVNNSVDVAGSLAGKPGKRAFANCPVAVAGSLAGSLAGAPVASSGSTLVRTLIGGRKKRATGRLGKRAHMACLHTTRTGPPAACLCPNPRPF